LLLPVLSRSEYFTTRESVHIAQDTPLCSDWGVLPGLIKGKASLREAVAHYTQQVGAYPPGMPVRDFTAGKKSVPEVNSSSSHARSYCQHVGRFGHTVLFMETATDAPDTLRSCAQAFCAKAASATNEGGIHEGESVPCGQVG